MFGQMRDVLQCAPGKGNLVFKGAGGEEAPKAPEDRALWVLAASGVA